MGKVGTSSEMKRKKKKGRPPRNTDFTPQNPIIYTRRNPKNLNSPALEFDDEDERKEKKVMFVGRLNQFDQNLRINQKNSRNFDSDFNDRRNGKRAADFGSSAGAGGGSGQEKKIVKVTETSLLHGSSLYSGPTIPLPDKNMVLFILDRLQKKDTYGVFSEPVDPNELPDYFDTIEHPMDFGTVRQKLDDGAYKNLGELEADVYLICSNAMQYNAPDTVYYRQARSIQDIAKRDFRNLKHEGDDGEPQPKVVRRGRPPGIKNQKKLLETFPADHAGSRLTSGLARATTEDKPTETNSYNLRKGPALYRYRPNDPYGSSYRSRENYAEWTADWNDEFPASILRADMKYGNKNCPQVDENRRDTYKQYHPKSSGNNMPVLSNSIDDVKRLVPVGLKEPLAYATSLARYAANLGPIAWKVASSKIESVLPPGTPYGPGWVGEIGASSQPLSFSNERQKSSNSTAGDYNSTRIATPSTSDLSSAFADGMVEAVKKMNGSQNEIMAYQGDANSWMNQFSVQHQPVYPVQHKPVYQSQGYNNSLNGWFGFPVGQGREFRAYGEAEEMLNVGRSSTWQTVPLQIRQNNVLIAPDLNARIAAGSPSSSSLQIGSPQRPDLALQL